MEFCTSKALLPPPPHGYILLHAHTQRVAELFEESGDRVFMASDATFGAAGGRNVVSVAKEGNEVPDANVPPFKNSG